MANPKVIMFKYPELAEILVKAQNISEGHWGIVFKFGIQGANVTIGPEKGNVLPAAIIPVLEIGIQEFDESNAITVDASVVNPKPSKSARPVKASKASKS